MGIGFPKTPTVGCKESTWKRLPNAVLLQLILLKLALPHAWQHGYAGGPRPDQDQDLERQAHPPTEGASFQSYVEKSFVFLLSNPNPELRFV